LGRFFFGVLEVFVTIDRTTDDVANGGDALVTPFVRREAWRSNWKHADRSSYHPRKMTT